MTPALTFFVGLGMLILFGWYFATDQGPRKRLLATTLMVLLVVFSIAAIWPPQKKIALGLDIQGGTSFLIRLVPGDKQITKGMLEQAVEVIRNGLTILESVNRLSVLSAVIGFLFRFRGWTLQRFRKRATSCRAWRNSSSV